MIENRIQEAGADPKQTAQPWKPQL